MARSDTFAGLPEFLAIATCGNFRKAAHKLGVTPGAISQSVRAMEARLGSPLFHRTTRSVALTEAGELLLRQIAPAAETIADSLAELREMGAKPSGTLRLLVQRLAMAPVIEPILPRFHRAFPEVHLEVTIGDDQSGLVVGGYDAGIRIGEYIDLDMIAVPVSKSFRWGVYGAPAYLEKNGTPRVPEEIARHHCIRYRRPDIGAIYRWEFERNGQSLTIDPPGSILVNDGGLIRSLGKAGLGLIYTSSLSVAGDVAEGTLRPVLEKFCPAQDAMFIYFPKASRSQPKLRAFIDTCKSWRSGQTD